MYSTSQFNNLKSTSQFNNLKKQKKQIQQLKVNIQSIYIVKTTKENEAMASLFIM